MSTDVRRLLASHRQSRRISSPYATYSLAGALFCSACGNLPVKSESLWDAHTRTASHRGNAANALPPKAGKRPKNDDNDEDDEGGAGGDSRKRIKVDGVGMGGLPSGFFDGGDRRINIDDDSEDEEEQVEEDDAQVDAAAPAVPTTAATTTEKTSALPSDFFSEKSSSAGPKDMDAEWDAFQTDIAKAEAEAQSQQQPPTSTSIAAAATTASSAAAAHVISAAPMSALQAASATEEKKALEIEEKEEEQDRMAEFFDEQSSLEDRVRALKEKREKLRIGASVGVGASMVGVEPTKTTIIRRGSEMDVDDTGGGRKEGQGEDDDEDDEEEDAFDAWARGGRWH